MQGIFVNGRRPKSKKAVKEAVAENPHKVRIEGTSVLGSDYDGPVSDMPDGEITFVGPDPYRERKFYGTIVKRSDKITVK